MQQTVSRTVCVLFCCFVLAGCAGRQAMPPRPALISHIVLITLNDPAQADAAIADCDAMLASIPGIVSYAAGRHVDTGRATVDGSYDLGLYIGFNSTEAYSGYVDHPSHVALVSKWKPAISQMRVFDVRDE